MYEIAISYTILVCLENNTYYEHPRYKSVKLGGVDV